MSRPDKLSVTLIAILVVLLLLAWGFGMSTPRPAPPSPGPVFMGLFLIALGAMFVASYFSAGRSIFLRALLRFATGFPWARDPKMAFVLALVCVIAGLGALGDGLRVS